MSDANPNAIDWTVPAHLGPSPAGVAFAEATFAAAWNIQGDSTRPPFADAVPRLFDIALPPIPNATVRRGALTALWLGPTSWLLVGQRTVGTRRFRRETRCLERRRRRAVRRDGQQRRLVRERESRGFAPRQGLSARLSSASVRGEHVRTKRPRACQRAFLPQRPVDVYRDRRAKLRTRRLAGIVPIGGAIWLRRSAAAAILARERQAERRA